MFWLINYIPSVIFHILLLISVVGILTSFFLGMVPFVSQYKTPIQIISILVLAFALYSEGSIANNEQWEAKVKEQEQKVALAEQKSADLNERLQEALNYKTSIIEGKKNEIIKEITQYVHDTCNLSNVAVVLHNSSAENTVPGSSIGTVTGTSDVEIVDLLKTITENYATYYELTEKLKTWQEWYKKNKEIFNKAQE
jgi:phenylpyruvate tautomerase PptA (4-oxalocrotonate tautomerase family)